MTLRMLAELLLWRVLVRLGIERLPDATTPPTTPPHLPQNRRSPPRPSPRVLRWEIGAPAATQAQPEGWQ